MWLLVNYQQGRPVAEISAKTKAFVDGVAAEELRSAQNEDLHRLSL